MAPLVAEEGDELGGEEGEVNVSLEDFTVHGLVGEGEFGKVSAGLGRGPGRGTRPRPGSGTRQYKTRQYKTRQGKARQGNTRQDGTRQDKTRQDMA